MSKLNSNDKDCWSDYKYLGHKNRFTKIENEYFKLLCDVIEIKGYQFECYRDIVQNNGQYTDDIEIQQIYHSRKNRGKKCPLCESPFLKAQANRCEKANSFIDKIELLTRLKRTYSKGKAYKL